MSNEQAAALQAAVPYLLAIVGLVGGPVVVVKGVHRFNDWLQETRRKAEAAEASASKAARDLDGIGRKVGRLSTRHIRARDRMARLEEDHGKLSDAFHASEKALPLILKDERHAIPDSPTGQLAASLDERVENLKEEHGRRIQKLEDKAFNGGKGA